MDETVNNFKHWKYLDTLFPEGGATIDGVWYSNEEIRQSNLSKINTKISKKVREMYDTIWEFTLYPNNDLTVRRIYSVFPPNLIDNIPALNIYGQKILNNL